MSERTVIVYIDYSKAFDRGSHIHMFIILNEMAFPTHIAVLIHALGAATLCDPLVRHLPIAPHIGQS